MEVQPARSNTRLKVEELGADVCLVETNKSLITIATLLAALVVAQLQRMLYS